MKRLLIGTLLFALAGAVTVLALQWHFSRCWVTYYSHYPFMGYSQAMKAGLIPPFLTTSTQSLLVTKITLRLLPLLTLWFAGGRLVNMVAAFLALWAGVMFSVLTIWVATPQLRNDSSMWPIDLVFLAFQTGVPLIEGGFAVIVVRAAIFFTRRHRDKQVAA